MTERHEATEDAPSLAEIITAPMTSAALLAERVRDEIYALQPDPGTHLFGLSELGKRTGSGPSVVREALQHLSAIGIIEVRRGSKGGVFAREVGPEIVSKSLETLVSINSVSRHTVIEARLEIEGLCARLAAYHATEQDVRSLAQSVERARRIGSNSAKFALENVTFHRAVAEASHNEIVIALTRSVRDLFFEETISFAYQTDALSGALRAHERLVELIATRKADAAFRLMRAHVHKFNRYVQSSGQADSADPEP